MVECSFNMKELDRYIVNLLKEREMNRKKFQRKTISISKLTFINTNIVCLYYNNLTMPTKSYYFLSKISGSHLVFNQWNQILKIMMIIIMLTYFFSISLLALNFQHIKNPSCQTKNKYFYKLFYIDRPYRWKKLRINIWK